MEGGWNMLEMILYGVGFFIMTIGIQALLHKVRKNGNKGEFAIWTGMVTTITICTLGIIMKNISFLAAVIGFVIADEIGKKMKWHE